MTETPGKTILNPQNDSFEDDVAELDTWIHEYIKNNFGESYAVYAIPLSEIPYAFPDDPNGLMKTLEEIAWWIDVRNKNANESMQVAHRDDDLADKSELNSNTPKASVSIENDMLNISYVS